MPAFWNRGVVRVPSELFALAQLDGTVASGPASGLSDPVVLRLGQLVDLGSGFIVEVAGRSLFSAGAVDPAGHAVGSGFRYWMWDAPCANWQNGASAEMRLIKLEAGDSRQGAHTDASLSGLAVDGADLDGVFDPTAALHTAVAPAGTEQVTVDAAANAYACGSQISPADADPLTAGHQVDLGAPGTDTAVTVTVTAADNTTTRSYTIDVARADSFNETALSGLAIDGVELSPGFDPEVADYSAEADVGQVTVSAQTVHLEATVVIVPDDADSDPSNGHQVDLGSDGASITVSVTAQDRTAVRFYSITVGRDGAQPGRSGRLAGITVGGEDIGFASGQQRFSATADAGATTVAFEAAGESVVKGFVLSAGGSEFVPVGYDGVVELTPGRDTLIAVRSSAPWYQRQNLYTVRLRAPEAGSDQQGSESQAPPPSGSIAKNTLTEAVLADSWARSVAQPPTPRTTPSDADPQLSALSVSPGVLTPAFEPGVNQYSVSVTHDVGRITLSATAAADRQVAVSAPDADSATAGIQIALNSPFSNGRSSQTAFVVAVSDNARTQSYTITVTRAAPSVPERRGVDLAADTTTLGRLAIDDYVTGKIDIRKDVDWYAVELRANRRYNFSMMGGLRGELTNAAITGLYTADGTAVGRPTRPSTAACRMDQVYWYYGDYVHCGVYTGSFYADWAFWNKRGSLVSYKPSTSGTYYIGVTTLHYWHSGTYRLILRDLHADLADYNYRSGSRLIGNIGQLEVGMPAAAFVDHPKVRFSPQIAADADYFEVDLVAGRRYRITGTDGRDATGHSTNILLPRPLGTGTTLALEYLQIHRVFLVTDSNGSHILTEIPPSWWTDDPNYHTPAPGTNTEGWYDRRWPSNPRTLTAPRTGTYRLRVGPRTCSVASCDGRSWGGYQVTVDEITDE